MMYVQLACVFYIIFKWTAADMKKEVFESLETCLDHKGKVVSHGDRFFPLGSDPCTQCTCLNGKPEMCISVFCSPPENCRQYHALSDKCCEFVCLDRDFPNKGSGNGTYSDSDSLSTTNLGLRLVASTVTSFLILALLLFMVHRLRQRRLLLMIRRFHARRMDTGNSHLSRRFSEDDDGSVGYFVGHDHLDFSRYDEPPPPYTLWKPPEMYIPPGEAPPPYDLSVQLTSPFPNTTRFNFVPSSNSENLQHMAVPILLSESHITSNHDTSLGTFSTSISTSIANQSLAVQPIDQMQSVSNMSIVSDPDVENPTAGISDRVALPPDIQYEESRTYRSSSTAGCTLQENSVLPDLNEEDMVNGNVIPDVVSAPPQDDVEVAGASCTCLVGGRKGKSWSKRHSCSEFTEQSKSRGSHGRTKDKRFSLGPVSNRQNNNFYPDPTAWSGEASESSSSSSPTYDQPTLSPSTSDSSSVDVDFSHDPLEHGNKGIVHRASGSKLPAAPSEILPTAAAKDNELTSDANKPPHFQKTLSHFKKFSLIKRKKKKRRDDKTNEISCSFVCQNVSDGVLTGHSHSYAAGPDTLSLVRNGENCTARPMEAINPHIGHKLASSGLKSLARPTNINIPGQCCLPSNSKRSGNTSVYSAGCSENDAPLSPAVVTVHYNSSKVSRFPGKQVTNVEVTSNHDLTCGDVQNYITQHHSIPLKQSPPSLHGITRSGSICSETGERRHHKSPLCSSPLSTSRPRNLDENSEQNHLDCASGSLYFSSICIPEGSRTAVSSSDNGTSSKIESSIIRSIPAWIANSMAVLPKQEYETPSAQQGMLPNLSRCLSMGQIEENSFNPIIGVNVPVTLEIRDRTLCDSSWEACSHL